MSKNSPTSDPLAAELLALKPAKPGSPGKIDTLLAGRPEMVDAVWTSITVHGLGKITVAKWLANKLGEVVSVSAIDTFLRDEAKRRA